MSYIYCPECNESISSFASFCPHCGLPGALIRYRKGITFGKYRDSANDNVARPLSWKVADCRDNKLLLVSKNIIDCQPFNNTLSEVTWETCSLRQWLNNEFFENAFSPLEKVKIMTSFVLPDTNNVFNSNGGSSTKDRIFILSEREAEDYLAFSQENVTDYANAKGVPTEGEHGCFFWLRNPGYDNTKALARGLLRNDNFVGFNVDNSDVHIGVRPALWVDLDAE